MCAFMCIFFQKLNLASTVKFFVTACAESKHSATVPIAAGPSLLGMAGLQLRSRASYVRLHYVTSNRALRVHLCFGCVQLFQRAVLRTAVVSGGTVDSCFNPPPR